MATINQNPPSWLLGKGRRGPTEKYPFRALEVGHTLRIEVDEQTMSFKSFRTFVSTKGRKLGRKFRCHLCEDGAFECYREA